jgi:nuclease HARBI1
MSQTRIVVEHGFSIVANTWPFLNAGWKMHLGASPVGRYYCAGVILSNGLDCIHPNQVSQYFECKPPKLADYFHH